MDFSRYLSVLEDVAFGSKDDDDQYDDERGRNVPVATTQTLRRATGLSRERQEAVNCCRKGSERHSRTDWQLGSETSDASVRFTPRTSTTASSRHDGSSPRRELYFSKSHQTTTRCHNMLVHNLEDTFSPLDDQMHRGRRESILMNSPTASRNQDSSSSNRMPGNRRTSRTGEVVSEKNLYGGVIEERIQDDLPEPEAFDGWETSNPDFMNPRALTTRAAMLSPVRTCHKVVLEKDIDEYIESLDRYTPAPCMVTEDMIPSPEHPRSEQVPDCETELQDSTLKEDLKEHYKNLQKKQHMQWFGHGKVWTVASLIAAWLGVISTILAFRSVAFVHLTEPIKLTPIYKPVFSTGMMRMEICFNDTATNTTGCEILTLESDDFDDNMFQLARLFLTLATVFGCFFTVVLSTSIYWESINLRPIGLGYLSSYFLQSFSMLFYDTEICRTNTCTVGSGCVFCIIACIAWIAACISTARMDAVKQVAIRRRRRERRVLRRKLREERKRKEMLRKHSTTTARTESTTSSNASREGDIEAGIPDEQLGVLSHC